MSDGITKIPASMFAGPVTNLEQISFSNTLTEIGNDNFYSSKIAEITLPQSLTKIGNHCFSSILISDLGY